MFDINEIEGKIIMKSLENGTRVASSIDTGKIIYAENERTGDKYKISFTKVNGSSYKAVLDFEDDRASKEAKLLTNGKICMLIFKSIVSMYMKNDQLHIIAAEELKFFE